MRFFLLFRQKKFPLTIIRSLSIFIFLFILVVGNGLFDGELFLIPFVGRYKSATNEYLSTSASLGLLDQSVYYHNIGNVYKNISKANIIFIGNSRMQMGWDVEMLRSLCAKNSISIYNLSCGDGEGYFYFNNLLEKYPVIGKIVFINIDKHFERVSREAKAALESGFCKSIWTFLEKQSLFRLSSVGESLFYEKLLSMLGTTQRAVLFRSFTDGFWNWQYYLNDLNNNIKCKNQFNNQINSASFSDLKKLIDILQKYKCTVFLTQIPSTDSSPIDAREIGNLLHVPVLTYNYPYDTLTTFDGSHLSQKSAQLFTKIMLPKIIQMSKAILLKAH